MKKFFLSAAVAGALATSAAASTVPSFSVQYFTGPNSVAAANSEFYFASPEWTVETFENPSTLGGNFEEGTTAPLSGASSSNDGEIEDSILSSVGSFTTLGGNGTGTTCTQRLDRMGDKCDNIALQFNPSVNGQGNIIPESGNWSVNTNDTKGLKWTLDNGGQFSQAVFALRDPGDQNQKTLTIRANGTQIYSEKMPDIPFGNDDVMIVRVFFGMHLSTAEMEIETSENDAFTIDGAGLNTVPLPAGVWMLLAGMGGLLAMRRRKAA
jgi:hypothetical protein